MSHQGGIIGKANKTSFGKGTLTSKTSTGTLTTQPGTRTISALVVAGGGGGGGGGAGDNCGQGKGTKYAFGHLSVLRCFAQPDSRVKRGSRLRERNLPRSCHTSSWFERGKPRARRFFSERIDCGDCNCAPLRRRFQAPRPAVRADANAAR